MFCLYILLVCACWFDGLVIRLIGGMQNKQRRSQEGRQKHAYMAGLVPQWRNQLLVHWHVFELTITLFSHTQTKINTGRLSCLTDERWWLNNVEVLSMELSRWPHHCLLIGFIDISVVLPGSLSVGVPHNLCCAVVVIQEYLCITLICILVLNEI